MRKINKIFSCDSGVVMMETIFTLPIYFIMLAGVFWLGELCIARLTFTSGENLRLWEGGLRHPFTPVPERTIYSFMPDINSSDEVVTGGGRFNFTRTSPPQIGGWGIAIVGTASMVTRRSDWSWSVNQGALNALGFDGAVSQGDQEMVNTTGRILLNRNVFTGRRLIYIAGTNVDAGRAEDESTVWQQEYTPRWTIGESVIQPPNVGTPTPLTLYNGGVRNGNYNQWSL